MCHLLADPPPDDVITHTPQRFHIRSVRIQKIRQNNHLHRKSFVRIRKNIEINIAKYLVFLVFLPILQKFYFDLRDGQHVRRLK